MVGGLRERTGSARIVVFPLYCPGPWRATSGCRERQGWLPNTSVSLVLWKYTGLFVCKAIIWITYLFKKYINCSYCIELWWLWLLFSQDKIKQQIHYRIDNSLLQCFNFSHQWLLDQLGPFQPKSNFPEVPKTYNYPVSRIFFQKKNMFFSFTFLLIILRPLRFILWPLVGVIGNHQFSV